MIPVPILALILVAIPLRILELIPARILVAILVWSRLVRHPEPKEWLRQELSGCALSDPRSLS